MLEIVFIFMIYVIVGWLWETSFVSFKEKKFINRGFLKGPYIPIYGFAFITLVLSIEIFNNLNVNPLLLILIQILYICLVSAIWEYLTSYILETIFHTRWWDYSYRKFNIHGRIAVDYTILFGIGGYLLWKFTIPAIESIYYQLSSVTTNIIIYVFLLTITIDTIYTLNDMFKLRSIIIKMESIKDEISDRFEFTFEQLNITLSSGLTNFNTAVGHYKTEIMKKLSELKEKGGSKVSESVSLKINQFSKLLDNSKNVTRFLKKYPKATSKKYKYIINILRSKK